MRVILTPSMLSRKQRGLPLVTRQNGRSSQDFCDFSDLKGAVTKSIRDVGRVGFATRRAALAVSSHCSGGAFRAGVAALGGSNTKCKRLRPFYTITSLVLSLDTQHVVLAINAAKGGDPMSHGSAGGSVKFVRELRF